MRLKSRVLDPDQLAIGIDLPDGAKIIHIDTRNEFRPRVYYIERETERGYYHNPLDPSEFVIYKRITDSCGDNTERAQRETPASASLINGHRD